MKGKNQFSKLEYEQLRILIKEKNKADKVAQKAIRNRIRNIGFYFSNYSSRKSGYDLNDLEKLIRSGEIKITETPNKKVISKTKQKEIIVKSIPKQISIYSLKLEQLLNEFSNNRFDPISDFEEKIPNASGNYIICLRKKSGLPKSEIEPNYKFFDGLKVIYTGIAGKSLRKRDYHQHFKGKNAGSSTLRKSLGVLFKYNLIPRDKNPTSRKSKFNVTDEVELSDWMQTNLIMYFLRNDFYDQLEDDLILELNPPLNLDKNKSYVNLDFRKNLSKLRNNRTITFYNNV